MATIIELMQPNKQIKTKAHVHKHRKSPLDYKKWSLHIFATLHMHLKQQVKIWQQKKSVHISIEINKEKAYPLGKIDVEFVESDMSSGEENFFNRRIDTLKNG